MALERKPQNLRGYGLAQDPKVELDTTFIDDQNRRAYQQRGIEAQQEAQQKNFAQRDKETRVDLLKGIPTIESNWSPEIKSKINAEIDAFIKGAGDLSTEEIVVGLNGLKSKAGAYKSIGTALKDRATKVAAGDIYSGLDGDKLLGLELEKDFEGLTFEEAMTKAMNITNSQFAPIPSAADWEATMKRRDELAKQGKPTLERDGTMMYGKEIVTENFAVDPALNQATLESFVALNSRYFQLNPIALEAYSKQLTGTVRGKSFQDKGTTTSSAESKKVESAMKMKEEIALMQGGDESAIRSLIGLKHQNGEIIDAIMGTDGNLKLVVADKTFDRGAGSYKLNPRDESVKINVASKEGGYRELVEIMSPRYGVNQSHVDKAPSPETQTPKQLNQKALDADLAIITSGDVNKIEELSNKIDKLSVGKKYPSDSDAAMSVNIDGKSYQIPSANDDVNVNSRRAQAIKDALSKVKDYTNTDGKKESKNKYGL